MAPVIERLRAEPDKFKAVVCVTAQHREMLDQVLKLFGIVPEHDLDLMDEGQDLFDITNRSLSGLRGVLKEVSPDLLLVQGDTTTAFASTLAAYYLQVPVGHVEAGLRTGNKFHPFPEELNRRMIGVLADMHFAPTEEARRNLRAEGVPDESITVTGNTGIDALLSVARMQKSPEARREMEAYFADTWGLTLGGTRRVVLVTAHRRENFGPGLTNICKALQRVASQNPDVDVVYPVHPNPNVRGPVMDALGPDSPGALPNVRLLQPLTYAPFVFLMDRTHVILTDSGGIQEEAPALGKPVLVMRETTERPDGLKSNNTRLVGTDSDAIASAVQLLLENPDEYAAMSRTQFPYGDGHAAEKIVRAITGD